MTHPFELSQDIELGATPEQVWDAIATGPGIDSWYMGRSEVSPAEAVRTVVSNWSIDSRVTAWEPGSRLAYGGEESDTDRFLAYEFLIEGRNQGSTVLRMVAHGFLPGDDWAEEFEAMTKGGLMYWHTLVAYVSHFAGRTATPLEVDGPLPESWDAAWLGIGRALGLDRRPATGDAVRLEIAPGQVVDGIVFYANPDVAGVRTEGGLYRFIKGFHRPMLAFHEIFDGPVDESHWTGWLQRACAA